MKDLRFFYMEGCPYCDKVRRYMEKSNINVEMVDINADPSNKEELIKLGGMHQVPMLLIDGKPMYESSDIITWFKENM